MKTLVFAGLLLLVLATVLMSCTSSEERMNAHLSNILADTAYLVDVRTPEEFSEGHVEGAVNIPLDIVEDNLDMFKDKKYIVLMCRSGNRSGKATKILEKHGFTNAVNGGSWGRVKNLLEKQK